MANLVAQPEPSKVALFLHCLGAKALKVYNGLSFDSEDDRQNLSKILEKFDECAIGEVNETYERYVFNSRNQDGAKSRDTYITDLRKLMKTCNFCDCLKDTLLRDRIVLGVHSKNLRKRLLQERKLMLKKCINICCSVEAATNQFKAVSKTKAEDVNKVGYDNHRKSRQFSRGCKVERNLESRSCKFCVTCQKGLGAALMQHGKPIAYTSRAMTQTEKRYAQLEKEMLVIVFALERFHQYTFGRPDHVYSKHHRGSKA